MQRSAKPQVMSNDKNMDITSQRALLALLSEVHARVRNQQLICWIFRRLIM